MMWFWFSVIAMLAWSGSDLFSKVGCMDAADRYSHLKMVTAVGIVMGAHAVYMMATGKAVMTAEVFITYLPVSCLYILSMAIGYLGLRYIELSISSPICNSSGALVAVTTIAVNGPGEMVPLQMAGLAAVCIGVFSLGFVDLHEDEELRAQRQSVGNRKYARSMVAILIPVVYCILDAAGTYADSTVLETLDENAANSAYELTFLLVGIAAAIYAFGFKKARFKPAESAPRFIAAVCETIGQFFYVFALADSRHVMFSAPIISGYCVVSVLWSRLLLKEKLSAKHYLSVLVTVIGIVILGLFDA